jgi:hypothetical protein
MFPFKVIEKSPDKFKLVSANYKGKGLLTDKQPSLEQFSSKDQSKLKHYVRHHFPCVTVVGGKISNQVLQDLLRKFYDKDLQSLRLW